MLPHHIRFALWVATTFRPFALANDESFLEFCQGLNDRYNTPHSETVWKILGIAEELTKAKLKSSMMKVKEQIGSPFLSLQVDMWTTKDCAESYVALNASFITRSLGLGGIPEYELEQALLDFNAFPYHRHTAINIEKWLKQALQDWGIEYKDIVCIVPNGGANVKKACRISGLNTRTCYAHDLQRHIKLSP